MSEIVESKEQFLIRIRDRELRGCTCRRLRLHDLQLVGVDLTEVIFEQCDLDGMTLTGANLTRTTFSRVDLRRTLVDRAILKRTTFTDCNITELNATRSMLEDVEFVRCDMDNAIFDHAYLGRCLFNPNRAYGLKMRGALLIRCRFSQDQGAPELTRAQFSDATFVETELPSACLLRADARNSLLVKCNLHHALLRDAQVEGSRLVGCVTVGADLPAGWQQS